MKNKYVSKNNIIPILKTIFGSGLKEFKRGNRLDKDDVVYNDEYVYKCNKAGTYYVIGEDTFSNMGLRFLPKDLSGFEPLFVKFPSFYEQDQNSYVTAVKADSRGRNYTQEVKYSGYFNSRPHNKDFLYEELEGSTDKVKIIRRLNFNLADFQKRLTNRGHDFSYCKNPMGVASAIPDGDPSMLYCVPSLSLFFADKGTYSVKANILFNDSSIYIGNDEYGRGIYSYHEQSSDNVTTHTNARHTEFQFLPINFDLTITDSTAEFSGWGMNLQYLKESDEYSRGQLIAILNNYFACNDPSLQGGPSVRKINSEYDLPPDRDNAQIETLLVTAKTVPLIDVHGGKAVMLGNLEFVGGRYLRLATFVGPITIERTK